MATQTAEIVVNIPIGDLVPRENQHRQHFAEEGIEALAQSMTSSGFLSHLTVRPASASESRSIPNGKFEVICGHRRLRAAKRAFISEIPCVVKALNDAEATELELLDNLNNESPLPWEEGGGYRAMVEQLGMTPENIGAKAGKAAATIRDRLAITEACEGRWGLKMKAAFLEKRLSVFALVELAALPEQDMAPKRCPGCQGVCQEHAEACPACGKDISDVLSFSAGSPRGAVLGLLLNGAAKGNDQVAEVVEKVKQSYGLSAQVVQTSLGFGDVQVSQKAVEVKTRLEKMLGEFGRMADWLAKDSNMDSVNEYTPNQTKAVLQQVAAARAVLDRIAAVCGAEVEKAEQAVAPTTLAL